MESMECPREYLNKDAQKKKEHFMYIRGGQAEIATDTKSLDNRYAYYVSNGDVIGSISKVDSAIRLCFNRGVY